MMGRWLAGWLAGGGLGVQGEEGGGRVNGCGGRPESIGGVMRWPDAR